MTEAHCTGPDCDCCADKARAALLEAAKAASLSPTRPTRGPTGPVVVNGAVVNLETASSDELLVACRALAEQFKDVVARQRENLRRLFADSTATDGFKIKVSEKAGVSRA